MKDPDMWVVYFNRIPGHITRCQSDNSPVDRDDAREASRRLDRDYTEQDLYNNIIGELK